MRVSVACANWVSPNIEIKMDHPNNGALWYPTEIVNRRLISGPEDLGPQAPWIPGPGFSMGPRLHKQGSHFFVSSLFDGIFICRNEAAMASTPEPIFSRRDFFRQCWTNYNNVFRYMF